MSPNYTAISCSHRQIRNAINHTRSCPTRREQNVKRKSAAHRSKERNHNEPNEREQKQRNKDDHFTAFCAVQCWWLAKWLIDLIDRTILKTKQNIFFLFGFSCVDFRVLLLVVDSIENLLNIFRSKERKGRYQREEKRWQMENISETSVGGRTRFVVIKTNHNPNSNYNFDTEFDNISVWIINYSIFIQSFYDSTEWRWIFRLWCEVAATNLVYRHL